jgi:superfamily II DNA helicase RecQ
MRLHLLNGPQDVKEKRYRIILTSPEMCLGNSGFAALLREPRWSRSILFIVVDDAHCIKQWGAKFQKHYSSLGALRSFVPRGVPVLATSATMPPDTLEDVRSILEMNAKKSFHLNLGNDRRNVVPLVWPVEGGASNLAALNFVVCGRDRPLRTIIYFNTIRLAMSACNHLRKLLPPSQVDTVDVLHAFRGPHAKKQVAERFRAGEVLVLCATGGVGMVCTCCSKTP